MERIAAQGRREQHWSPAIFRKQRNDERERRHRLSDNELTCLKTGCRRRQAYPHALSFYRSLRGHRRYSPRI
ncbi:hypothetical protein KCP74_15835 [Salmonella enterica subsp. enterica]|nr:hypothetical protein KCP74_15835 [Salmonella enterica subsp. enterica]